MKRLLYIFCPLWLAVASCAASGGERDDDGPVAEVGALQASPGCARRAELGPLAPLCDNPLVKNLQLIGTSFDERMFLLSVVQPIDHATPSRGTFELRVRVVHRGANAPTVLENWGYKLNMNGVLPLTDTLGANAVSVENRFFGPSTPLRPAGGEPPLTAWQYLTVAQIAADQHRVIEVLKPVFKGPWISTGRSRGGQAVLYHRRFYPNDVVGTVAEVAPLAVSDADPRFSAFLRTVGSAACRDRLRNLQRALLSRRNELLPRLTQALRGKTFTRAGSLEVAYEHAVQFVGFAFYQYGTAADCNTLTAPEAAVATLLERTDLAAKIEQFSDQNVGTVDAMAAYYYHCATQEGGHGPLEDGLTDLLKHPGTYSEQRYAPKVAGLRFDEAPMRDLQRWLLDKGERILLVYGERDPWTAGAAAVPAGRDVYKFIEPGGNHEASLGTLPDATRARGLAVVARWAGVTLE